MKKKSSSSAEADRSAARSREAASYLELEGERFPFLTSRANPRLQLARSIIVSSAARREHHLLPLSGEREIQRAIEARCQIASLLVSDAWLRDESRYQKIRRTIQELRHPPADRQAPLETPHIAFVDDETLSAIEYGDRKSELIAIAHYPERTREGLPLSHQSLFVVLDQLEKPGNLGAVARSADAVGATALFVTDGTQDLFNPNAIRASMGAVLAVPTFSGSSEETLQWLDAKGCQIIALRGDARTTIWETELDGPLAIVLGTEAHGLGDRWQRPHIRPVRIPMHGIGDSLNVSVAAAVTLFEVLRRRHAMAVPIR
jgi:TrmH family RNA methyltransferase